MNGAMAAVGLSWEEAKERCFDGVVAACHNGQNSVTISGDAEKVAFYFPFQIRILILNRLEHFVNN